MKELLTTIDYGLMAMGGAMLFTGCVLWRWRHQSWRDPLTDAPDRSNKLSPEHLIIVMMATLVLAPGVASVSQSLLPANWPKETLDIVATLIGTITSHVMMACICLYIASFAFKEGWHGLGLTRQSWKRDLCLALICLLISICLCNLTLLATEVIVKRFWPGFEQTHTIFKVLQDPEISPAIVISAYASAVIFAPLGEELFFRGIVQSTMATLLTNVGGKRYARHLAVLSAATLFGLVHTGMPHHIPALILFGLILGYSYEYTGSLRVPILLHMLFNGKSILWFVLTAQSLNAQ